MVEHETDKGILVEKIKLILQEINFPDPFQIDLMRNICSYPNPLLVKVRFDEDERRRIENPRSSLNCWYDPCNKFIDVENIDLRIKGDGFGTKIMDALEDMAQEDGFKSARATYVIKKGKKFWEKRGYEPLARLAYNGVWEKRF